MGELITIDELKELREKIKQDHMEEQDYMKIFELFPILDDKKEESVEENSMGQEQSFQLSKTNPSIPSLLDKKAGFSNIIYLASISLVFEILFLAISILIYQ